MSFTVDLQLMLATASIAGSLLIAALWWNRKLANEIAERKAVERELRLFSRVIEQSPAAVLITDPQSRIEYVNPAFSAVTGYSLAEILGQKPSLLKSGLQDADDYRRLWGTLQRGEVWRGELANRRKDGELFWENAAIGPVFDEQGQLIHYVAVKEDITERKRTERSLHDQLHFQDALLDTIPNPIFIKDRDARFVGCNTAYEEAFGTSRGRLLGQTALDLHERPEAERSAEYAEDRRLITEGGTHHRERTLRFADGREHHLLYWIVSFDLSDGQRGGLIGVMVDISALKQAQHLAEEATRAKSAFLATMSHEIRTPMNAIISTAHLALDTELSSKQQQYLSRIEGAARSLLRLLNDILDFSKIEAGQLDLEAVDFRLQEVLDLVAQLLAAKAEAKGLALRFEVAPAVPGALIGDPLRLRQILLNLAGNAVKFSERGEICIRVGVEQQAGPDWLLRFSVEDTGIGLSEAQQAKLFRAFSQADTSMTRRYGGSGLGLAICKRLSELMGGRIGVESRLGQGSTFWFSARFRRPARLVDVADKLPGAPLQRASRLCCLRLLLVEDDRVNQRVAYELLTRAGAEVSIAHHGQEAIQQIRQQRFDAVLMDIQMPIMDGLSATRAIRALPGCECLPILAMTAHAMSGDHEKSIQAGMNDHITKPIDPPQLFARLQYWLGDRSDRGRALASAPRALGNEPGWSPLDEPGLPQVAPAKADKTGHVCAESELRAILEALAPEVRARRATRCRAALQAIQARSWPAHLGADLQALTRLLGQYRFQDAHDQIERLFARLAVDPDAERASPDPTLTSDPDSTAP
ncbi:MAG: PAS domain S-box protein [Lamprobacter sp.]|uniref:PAS domain S-box protein n=1 Tax=Lamprobacter sp. TaxID=3100796 RepID=UPI002B259DB2|nr:PAS domain S-box protein [Lamprobacter sp.]MEA3641315.1 PAS domain S-box protein [Lamprobacter sp.]